MSWYWKPYVSAAAKKEMAKKAVALLEKKGEKLQPVVIEGRTIAHTFWGKSWCDHLEALGDYDSRLPRGRTYARNGSVLDLKVTNGKITGLVQGSSLYKVEIKVQMLEPKKWKSLINTCSGSIGSVIEILQGKFSSQVMKTVTDKNKGMFPLSKEIKFKCSCPDWASMCKHVAAVLYGVGARLDHSPELIFKLRDVDHLELISQTSLKASINKTTQDVNFEHQDLSDLFGIEISPKATAAIASPKISKKVRAKKVASKKKAQKKKTTKKKIR